ncbi:MAG: VOC family protein [Rhodobacterales bacterium]|nr:VOC family protein [Rhodobacterales bacterium]MDX5499959.1 VOC family protein [Rhodobacterales bacterium]
MLRLDHVAVACAALADGAEAVEAVLGVPLAPGGEHAAMGTHNRLLSLGAQEYLEVIAINPAAPAPGRPRWFDLDRFSGPPRLASWVCACDDMGAALAACPPGSGFPMDLARGDLRWQMAVPEDGRLPFDGVFPALIRWQGPAPAPRLPDQGVRLTGLRLSHPRADALRAALAGLIDDPRLSVTEGVPGLSATFSTPHGVRQL